jgi:glutaredoxin-like protein NrdH
MPREREEMTLPPVTVYSNLNCVQCEQTKRYLTNNGVEFEAKMIQDSPEIFELIEAKGYKAAPVVVVGNESWSGFKLERLADLVKRNH